MSSLSTLTAPTPRPRRSDRRSAAAIAALALAGALAAAAPAGAAGKPAAPAKPAAARLSAADLSALLQGAGIQPVDPPVAAADFTLPTLAGGRMALADERGSWLVLTFFATWCGPCRAELPTLEQLYRDRGGRGLAIVGVSIDSEPSAVPSFVQQMGLSFPVLLDGDGRVGGLYRASSIPLSYLIDPAGRIVGLSRGSRDWSALGGLLDRIRGLAPAADAGTETASAGGPGGPVQLPAKLIPPTATVELAADTPHAGDTFDLAVAVRWDGGLDQYQLLPPHVDLPDGVTRRRVTAETSSEAGAHVVTYHLALTAAKPGRYALDPVELRYTPTGENEPVASRIAGPTVEVLPATVLGLAPRTLAWGGGGAAGLLALVGLGFGWRRRARRRRSAGDSAAAVHEALAARFAAARKRRLDGDAAGFLEGLAAIETDLDRLAGEAGGTAAGEPAGDAAPPGAAERAAFARLLEGARYGGRRPSRAELDPHERRVERRIAALRPDPARREREAIAYARPAERAGDAGTPASRIHDLIEEGR